jgi:hypothetical protein
LLIQGSVQPPPVKILRADWERAMCEIAQSGYGVSWAEFEPGTALSQRVAELVAKTYGKSKYNRRR